MTRYRIVPERSQVWIDARSNVHPIHSSTDGLEGYVELALDAAGKIDLAEAARGKLTLPVSRLSSGNAMEDREMQRRVDARRFPSIEGVLTGMEGKGEDHTYEVKGDISFKGVTRSYQDRMTVTPVDDDTIELSGQSRFDIREFGMEPPRILLLKVQPEVDVRVAIHAVKEA